VNQQSHQVFPNVLRVIFPYYFYVQKMDRLTTILFGGNIPIDFRFRKICFSNPLHDDPGDPWVYYWAMALRISSSLYVLRRTCLIYLGCLRVGHLHFRSTRLRIQWPDCFRYRTTPTCHICPEFISEFVDELLYKGFKVFDCKILGEAFCNGLGGKIVGPRFL